MGMQKGSAMRFEYDPNKSASNKAKHGVDFEEAQALWEDPYIVVIDAVNSDEPRSAWIGVMAGRHWTAITTNRGGAIRIISVRRSHKAEEALYERDKDDQRGGVRP